MLPSPGVAEEHRVQVGGQGAHDELPVAGVPPRDGVAGGQAGHGLTGRRLHRWIAVPHCKKKKLLIEGPSKIMSKGHGANWYLISWPTDI